MRFSLARWWLLIYFFLDQPLVESELRAEWKAGAAAVNITPNYPVRLSGYGNRTTEHAGVKVDLWAKALALSWDGGAPAVLLTVDNCGVPASLRSEVLLALRDAGVQDTHLAICSTHTHCAPMVNGTLRNMFGVDLPPEEQARIDRYTCDLREWMIRAALRAIKEMRPANLEFGIGKATFAMNRRLPSPSGFVNRPNPQGPVDHDLPVLKVTDANGQVKAIFNSYACHCTTLNWNYIHPDWAGIAQLRLQMSFPQAVAMTAIGCGADQNPFPRQEEDDVRSHGIHLAEETVNVLIKPMRTISGPLRAGQRTVQLPYQPYSKAEWEERAKSGKSVQEKTRARTFLGKMERGEAIPKTLAYGMQVWNFSNDLAMVFLNGEVVVDYGLRLKREFDKTRLWVNAYSNDVPCYIPSERVLKEGGYEPDYSMVYYLKPGRLAPGLEAKIFEALHALVPKSFKTE